MPSKPDLSLVLDLSASLCVGLVASDGRTLSKRVKEQGARGETAHALLDECLAEAGLDIADISDICVGVGPGSFTGIRVCAAMAQGLAFAGRLPLYPFSSLYALEVGAVSATQESVVAAIAANAGRFFVRSLDAAGTVGAPILRERLLSAEDTMALGGRGVLLVTSGNVPDRERLLAAFGRWQRFEDGVDFGGIARLAKGRSPVLDGVLRPNYLMASAAEDKRRAEGTAGSVPRGGVAPPGDGAPGGVVRP
ncbi:MAG: tRNA (adenosine(37)-N6)-threonylcarbamoyltransferase complex dimerization subunit type 1 TsaB [Fibrobacteria bacterium]